MGGLFCLCKMVDEAAGLFFGVLGLTVAVVIGFLLTLFVMLRVCLGKQRLNLKAVLPVVIFAVSLSGLFALAPEVVDKALNSLEPNQVLQPVSQAAEELHKTLWVADMHADSLLWPARDLNQLTHGHVDIPKLLEGNVALQAFTIVTSSPLFLNFESNPHPTTMTDSITLKTAIEMWGLESVSSLAARTLFQVNLFNEIVEESNGRLFPIKWKEDLKHYLNIRKTNNITSGILGIEGLHALDGKLENVDRFYDAGIRMMAPVHFFDNKLGGSAHGLEKPGLTEFGESVIRRMEEKHILIDVSHSSEKLIDDVLRIATTPIVVSHTGVRAICPSQRNLRDDHLIGIAKSGGVIGVTYFKPAQCGDNILDSIVKTIVYLRDLIGVQAIGLGSDYDGTVKVPFDTSKLSYITDALLRENFSHEEIELIMGKNFQRVLAQVLPNKP